MLTPDLLHDYQKRAVNFQCSMPETFAEARVTPFEVTCGTAKYTFKEGVTERRADTLLRRISKVPKRHFEVR